MFSLPLTCCWVICSEKLASMIIKFGRSLKTLHQLHDSEKIWITSPPVFKLLIIVRYYQTAFTMISISTVILCVKQFFNPRCLIRCYLRFDYQSTRKHTNEHHPPLNNGNSIYRPEPVQMGLSMAII